MVTVSEKRVVPLRNTAFATRRVVRSCEVPVNCVDVAGFIRALFEPEILAAIEKVQEDTCDAL